MLSKRENMRSSYTYQNILLYYGPNEKKEQKIENRNHGSVVKHCSVEAYIIVSPTDSLRHVQETDRPSLCCLKTTLPLRDSTRS